MTVQVATQLLKTATIENIVGYHIHFDPCPMLLVQPKEDAAEQFSKERIAPFIRATPVLRDLVGTGKTRSSDETLLYKAFPGGFLALVGAGSPDNLARRPIRIALYDEVDKYPVTREGDAIAIGDERLASAANSLSIRVCSPTIAEESRIEASYLESDQRRASMVCPHCQHRMFPTFFPHVQWEKDEEGVDLPKTARIYCEACNQPWQEGQRLRALETIRWHQTRPFTCCGARQEPLELYRQAWAVDGLADPVGAVWDWWSSNRWAVYRGKCSICGVWAIDNEHAGFQAGKLYSPWPNDSPRHQVRKFIAAKKSEELMIPWWNTQQGMTYRSSGGKTIEVDALAARREVWAGEIPDGVGIITVGIDVQDYRVELEVVGWGRDEESWSIDYQIIPGAFGDLHVQEAVDKHLLAIRRFADGRGLEVMATCIDSGGHHTEEVYRFSKARLGRRVWAIKGASEKNGQRQPVWPTKIPTSKTKKSFRPTILGVNAAKDNIRERLLKPDPGAGYMHFPSDRDLDYFHQLLAEKIKVEKVAGIKIRKWEPIKGRANEALDCRVYAYAALCGLRHMGVQLNKRVETIENARAPRKAPPPPPPAAADDVQPAYDKPKAPTPKGKRRSFSARLGALNSQD
ncbi:phage terminase large subunit GpA-like protein [Caulobacter sp. 1776]